MASALIPFLVILLAVAALEYFQVSRARWLREENGRLHNEMHELRASFAALARAVRIDLDQLASQPRERQLPRRRMPLVDRHAYWRDEQEAARTLPSQWWRASRGQGLVEYALIIAFVVIVVVGGLMLLGPPINAAFQAISQIL